MYEINSNMFIEKPVALKYTNFILLKLIDKMMPQINKTSIDTEN